MLDCPRRGRDCGDFGNELDEEASGTAARVVHLDSLEHGSVTLQLASTPVPAASAYRTVAKNLEDIPVACKFPNVFSEDLRGMPLDQDIEFTIELQSGTIPISRRSYKMMPKELAELKM
jgi:ATP phosphoribosyltransferase